jgi:hypothetical protein
MIILVLQLNLRFGSAESMRELPTGIRCLLMVCLSFNMITFLSSLKTWGKPVSFREVLELAPEIKFF